MCTHNCRQGRACQFPCPTRHLADCTPSWAWVAVTVTLVLTAAVIGITVGYLA